MTDELSSDARDFLSLATSGADVAPNDADRKRVRKGVGLALAATSAAGVAATAGSASAAAGSAAAGGAALATGGLGIKAIFVAALVTVAGAGAYSIASVDEGENRAPSDSASRATPPDDGSPSVPALPMPHEGDAPEAPSPSVVPETLTPETLTPDTLTPDTLTPDTLTPEALPELPTPPSAASAAAPRRARNTNPPRNDAHETSSPRAEAPPTLSLSDELGLLRTAQRARVQGNFDEALRQLDEHSRRFPAGRLAAERDGTRVFVLCDAARIDEATTAQRSFLREHSTSPLAHRVRRGCD